MRSSASDDTTSCKLTAATQRTTFDVPRRVCIVRYTGFAAKNKSARVGLRHVRTTPQTTPEQQKAGRIQKNQQHTTHRKDPSLSAHSSCTMPSGLPTHGSDVPRAGPRRNNLLASMQRHGSRANARKGNEEAPGEAASSTIHP